MLVCLSAADLVVNAGDVYECDADEAARMLAAGFAEPLTEKRVETRPEKKPVARRASRGDH